ncbi:MAG: gamma carbonic anhydrase family protein [Myxococcales bacterium]|nr:gamma carbonic anhydrase family protein [Myxococcales bacterium]
MSLVLPFEGERPDLAEDVYLAPTATVIGKVRMGERSSVWFGAVLRGDVGRITVGRGTNVQDLTLIHVTGDAFDTRIGDGVTVGHRCVIHGCVVEDGCLIGNGAIVLDGAVVGRDSIVAAGAVVPPGMQIPPRSMVMGIPGKVTRRLDFDAPPPGQEGAEHYVELARKYRGAER